MTTCIAAKRRCLNNSRLISLLFLAQVVLFAPHVKAGEPEDKDQLSSDLKKVLRDWKRRRENCSSVRYSLEGLAVIRKGSYTGDPFLPPEFKGKEFPEKDYTYERKRTYVLDFEKNRVRKESLTHFLNYDNGKFFPYFTAQLYDGKTFKTYTPKAVNAAANVKALVGDPDLTFLAKENESQTCFQFEDLPVFLAHGIVPSSDVPIHQAKLRLDARIDDFISKGKGVLKGRRTREI